MWLEGFYQYPAWDFVLTLTSAMGLEKFLPWLALVGGGGLFRERGSRCRERTCEVREVIKEQADLVRS